MLYDKDIREPLFEFLETEYGKVRILEEKNMGSSRADVVMVSPFALFGIEIKSDADTYTRLASQVKDYDKYFDYNYVVVGTSHAMSIEEHVPEYWGIITVEEDELLKESGVCLFDQFGQRIENDKFCDYTDGFDETDRKTVADFYILRHPKVNPKMDWKKKLGLLWKPELSMIQELNGMPKYKEKSRSFVVDKIVERLYETIEPDDLRRQVSQVLFERDYTNVKAMLKEYRKSETQKLLEKETDPQVRAKLIEAAAKRAENLPTPKRRYRKRRRKKQQ